MRYVGAAVLGVLLLGASAGVAKAGYPYYYQWYSGGGGGKSYYYTYYYYGPSSYHHVYYYPSVSKRYVYYYNWQKKRYWGRYDLETGLYSLLPEDRRKENLSDIAESDFPEPVSLDRVKVPGGDGETMTAPPGLP